jgi:Tfp pilus assembly protein PilV
MANATFAPNRLHSLDLDAVTSMEQFTAQDPVKLANTLTAKFIVAMIANTLTAESTARNRVAAANTLMARFIVHLWANPVITSIAESTVVPIVNILTAQCIVHRAARPVRQYQLAQQHRPGVVEL